MIRYWPAATIQIQHLVGSAAIIESICWRHGLHSKGAWGEKRASKKEDTGKVRKIQCQRHMQSESSKLSTRHDPIPILVTTSSTRNPYRHITLRHHAHAQCTIPTRHTTAQTSLWIKTLIAPVLALPALVSNAETASSKLNRWVTSLFMSMTPL